MFKLQDIRKTRVWQEAHEEGMEKGRVLEKKQLAELLKANAKTHREIAQLLEISLAEVRRLTKK